MLPTSTKVSAQIRKSLSEITAKDDPDQALIHWMEMEYAVIRKFEQDLGAKELLSPLFFDDEIDVDRLLNAARNILNRRKFRMRRALGNHLEFIFKAFKLPFIREAVTENHERPDFLFPSIKIYKNAPEEGNSSLTMLATEFTGEDNWRDALWEAQKIPTKHFLTFNPVVTESKTEQMKSFNMQLVTPRPFHKNYTPKQQKCLWTLEHFIKDTQARLQV